MRRKHYSPGMKQRVRGFTLVEAMVALVVLSVGLLGVAGLQMSGMRSVQGAQYRTDSNRLAEGQLDRMRANMRGLRGQNYSAANDATKDCSTGTCDPKERAAHDLRAWSAELRELLKLPADTDLQASVACTPDTCGVDSVITVAVAWSERNEDREAADNDQLVTKSYILSTVL